MPQKKQNETTLSADTPLNLGPWVVTPAEFASMPLADTDANGRGMMVLANDQLRFRSPVTIGGHTSFVNFRVIFTVERDPVLEDEVTRARMATTAREREQAEKKAHDANAARELEVRRLAEIRDAEAKARVEAAEQAAKAAQVAAAQIADLPALAETAQRLASLFAPKTT